MWRALEVLYEGTNQIKESKIGRLTREYELFRMEENETIHSMITCFTFIVNQLNSLGKSHSTSEQVKKILRSLPKEWRAKTMAIKEV